MDGFWAAYGLFLAKAVTGVLALAGLALALSGTASRRGRGRLEVRDLNRRYDELAGVLEARVVPRRERRREARARRRRAKAEARQRSGDRSRRPRIFGTEIRSTASIKLPLPMEAGGWNIRVSSPGTAIPGRSCGTSGKSGPITNRGTPTPIR